MYYIYIYIFVCVYIKKYISSYTANINLQLICIELSKIC